MPVFVDSGILLRAVHRADPHYTDVRLAIRLILARKELLFTGLQQIAEFWNVCTRPAGARGGFDLTLEETARRLRRIERGVRLITETPLTPEIWKSLVQDHAIKGVQVHDARLAALMMTHSISDLLTLNKSDFLRYQQAGVRPMTLADVLAQLHRTET